MPVPFPDIIVSANPLLPVVDSSFVKGGGRVVANLTALYALSTDVAQLTQNVTKVWVTSANAYYILTDIASVGSSAGWTIESNGSQDLQSVTTIGNTTDVGIFVDSTTSGATVSVQNAFYTNEMVPDSYVIQEIGSGFLGRWVAYINDGIPAIEFQNNTAAHTGGLSMTSVITANRTWTLPDNTGTIALLSDISIGNVVGTTNRISVTGTTTKTVDIDSAYIGQSSITTLGTITTGVWNGTAINDTYISSAATWNAKQSQLNGTGFVKASGTTISYDNSTYYLASNPNGYTTNTGTVTSIVAGTGLSGGTIATSGTISMPNIGTAGTYGDATHVPVITTDAQGRVTAVTNTTITAGAINSVASSDNSLAVTTTTGAVNAVINTAHSNVFGVTQAITNGASTGVNYDGFLLQNPNPATSSSVFNSPSIHWQNSAWDRATLNAAVSEDWIMYSTSTIGSGTTNGVRSLVIASSINGAAYSVGHTFSAGGGFTFNGIGSITGATTFNSSITVGGVATFNNTVSIALGKKLTIATGTNAITGTATLSSGTVTVSTTAVTAASLIWVQYQSGGTLSGATLTRGIRVSTQTVGTSFVIVAETAPGTTNTSDNSPIQWWVIN